MSRTTPPSHYRNSNAGSQSGAHAAGTGGERNPQRSQTRVRSAEEVRRAAAAQQAQRQVRTRNGKPAQQSSPVRGRHTQPAQQTPSSTQGRHAQQAQQARQTRQTPVPSQGSHAQQAQRARYTANQSSAEKTRGVHRGSHQAQGQNPAKTEAPARPKSRYIPALDGLRAFAVLAVIAYHMGMPWATGGLLGVTIFFVLSGYLITSLLVIEFQGTGRINLPQFWLRRVRRLVPAIVFVLVSIAVLCTLFNHALLTKLRPDVLPSLFFFNNWWQIFHNVSYFDALGSPSPVTHFWSLAIEEQFYLIWPVLLFILMKLGVKKRFLSVMTLVLALASALEMGILFDPHGDPSRVYYGTDTRAFSLLIGAWLAFVWPSNQLGATDNVKIGTNARRALDGVGILAFIGLCLMVAFADGFSPFLYRGGLVLCSVLTAIVIAVLVHPASILGKFWGLSPFVWIGKRSYGIYLWHYPLLLLIVPQNGLVETPWWMLLVALAAIFACSAFSYRFVENPIRHGAIGQLLADIANRRTTLGEWMREHIFPVIASVALVAVAVGGLIFVPDTSALEGGDLLKDESAQVGGPTAGALSGDGQEASEQTAKLDVLMIGDSVSVRAIPYFQEAFPYGAIDSAVNRQLYVGQDIYKSYADQDIVGDVVVFALGTNGVATDEQLDTLIGAVGADKHIWLINTRSTTSWMGETNDTLARAADRYDNVELIDWYNLSAGHGDWFDGDGTHLSEAGAQAYVDMVKNAVQSYLPEHEEGDERAELKNPVQFAVDSLKSKIDRPFGKMLSPLLTPIDPTAE